MWSYPQVVGPKTLATLAVVVVVSTTIAAMLLFSTPPAANTTIKQTSEPFEFISMHLETFGRRDVALILNNYAGDAEVVWSGESGGLAGRYRGVNAIRAFFTTVLTNSDEVELKAIDTSGSVSQDGTAKINSHITIRGHNAIIGEFSGEALATYLLTQTPNGWRIKLESWDFKRFDAEGPGSTVFPQWAALHGRRTGQPAHDPVKGLFWSLSEVSPFIIALAALVVIVGVFVSRKIS
ncbi:MAG: hypothetical protein QW470_07665 [Candidatus Caldarchaeum sp.]